MASQVIHHVLVIEDETDMARVLEFNLSRQGWSVTVATTGEDGLDSARRQHPHLVMLDLRLPGINGLEVLRALKENPATGDIPVVVASALGDEETVVEALNLGAEDYVTKPFRLKELMARVSAVLRRRAENRPVEPVLNSGDIHINLETRRTQVRDKEVDLTRSEFDLLAYFLRNPERACTRAQLCHQALGSGGTVQERTIDAHIRTIRRKLGQAGNQIATVWGIGYRLEPDEKRETPPAC